MKCVIGVFHNYQLARQSNYITASCTAMTRFPPPTQPLPIRLPFIFLLHNISFNAIFKYPTLTRPIILHTALQRRCALLLHRHFPTAITPRSIIMHAFRLLWNMYTNSNISSTVYCLYNYYQAIPVTRERETNYNNITAFQKVDRHLSSVTGNRCSVSYLLYAVFFLCIHVFSLCAHNLPHIHTRQFWIL